MSFPSAKEIESLQTSRTDLLCNMDRQGLFFAPGENLDAYKKRLLNEAAGYRHLLQKIQNGKNLSEAAGFPVGRGTPITPEIIQEAALVTEKLYGFTINWVPGFFLTKGLGMLWGGCTVTDDKGLQLFFIRKGFKNKQHWFLYDRDELLAHELCHAARSVFQDCELEEHFAYATAKSALRRYMGNCFRTELDALLFL